jgi:hypothetical protein
MSECRLILLVGQRPFNHGVEGSSPSALTMKSITWLKITKSPEALVSALRLQTDCRAVAGARVA